MKKLLLLLVVLGSFSSYMKAQDRYSYVSDRKFTDPVDLVGFNFSPNMLEVRDEMEQEIEPGEYSFGITQSNLYVSGSDIKGVYSLNNINSTDYGFKMLLMNARDPTIQGHLKIILNPSDQVEALIFKRSTNEPEMIFYQAEINATIQEKETAFFTDILEMEIPSVDSLWGKTIYPFLKIHHDVGTQQRLIPADSTSITFVEKITIVDKTKVKKKKKKKKKKQPVNIELGLPDEEAEEETTQDKEDVEEAEEEMAEAPELVVDPGAMPPVTEEDVAAAKKNLKITKDYFVVVRSILAYDDGSVEDKTWEFPVKKVVEREDAQAGPMEERFQIEISLMKGNPLYLYLTGKRTVSSFEMGEKQFLMRGH